MDCQYDDGSRSGFVLLGPWGIPRDAVDRAIVIKLKQSKKSEPVRRLRLRLPLALGMLAITSLCVSSC